MHAQPKQKFWDHVQEEVEKEINKTHGSLNKAVHCWEKERRRVLQAMEDGKHSGEEEDKKELLIALDEWIDLINGLKEKQKAREDCLGRAAEDTETLQ